MFGIEGMVEEDLPNLPGVRLSKAVSGMGHTNHPLHPLLIILISILDQGCCSWGAVVICRQALLPLPCFSPARQ